MGPGNKLNNLKNGKGYSVLTVKRTAFILHRFVTVSAPSQGPGRRDQSLCSADPGHGQVICAKFSVAADEFYTWRAVYCLFVRQTRG